MYPPEVTAAVVDTWRMTQQFPAELPSAASYDCEQALKNGNEKPAGAKAKCYLPAATILPHRNGQLVEKANDLISDSGEAI